MYDDITIQQESIDMSPKHPQPNGEERKKMIEEHANKKKAQTTSKDVVKPDKAPPTKIPMEKNMTTQGKPSEKDAKKAMDKELEDNVSKKATKEKKVKDPNKLSISDVARELGMDPKNARKIIRKAQEEKKCPIDKPEGRWELVDRGSNKHSMLVALLKESAEEEKDEEEGDDEE